MFPSNYHQQQHPRNNRNCPPFGDPSSQTHRPLNNNPFNQINSTYNSFVAETERSSPGRQSRSAIFGWGPNFNFESNPFKNANNEQGNQLNQPAIPPQQNDISQNLNEAMNSINEGPRRNLSEGNQRNPEGQAKQNRQLEQPNQQNQANS
jgi:hypothetical protein